MAVLLSSVCVPCSEAPCAAEACAALDAVPHSLPVPTLPSGGTAPCTDVTVCAAPLSFDSLLCLPATLPPAAPSLLSSQRVTLSPPLLLL